MREERHIYFLDDEYVLIEEVHGTKFSVSAEYGERLFIEQGDTAFGDSMDIARMKVARNVESRIAHGGSA